MDVNIHSHNLEITERLESYVEKKTDRLDRYMPNLTEVNIDLSTENTRSVGERQVAQITVRDDRGTILRAEERSNDIFAAIDAVIDKLYRQIKRYRGKQKRRWRGNAAQEAAFMGDPLPLAEEENEDDEQNIVRYKRFPIQPMSTEEAIDQMELLGHDFFVFFSAEEEAINVLYRRRDGNYGLLQPDLD